MIQLAMPIEPGNSGGPLLDFDGRVHGILTMKSRVTRNLGFAVTINSLKPLLDKPNPVPIARWLTIGALDETRWEPLFDARWRQRAGRIVVDGVGSGFGGRSLCLSHDRLPYIPTKSPLPSSSTTSRARPDLYSRPTEETALRVLSQRRQFAADLFEGPDISSWTILAQEQTPNYRPGQWNTLKVRHADDGLVCSVNGHVVIESDDARLTAGRVGLAKFRDTYAEFKGFRVAPQVPDIDLPAANLDRIAALIDTRTRASRCCDSTASAASRPPTASG